MSLHNPPSRRPKPPEPKQKQPEQMQQGPDPFAEVLLVRETPKEPGGETEVTVPESAVATFEADGWRRAQP